MLLMNIIQVNISIMVAITMLLSIFYLPPNGIVLSKQSAQAPPRTPNGINPILNLQLGHSTKVDAITFSPDGRYLLTEGNDTALLWDLLSRSLEAKVEHNDSDGLWNFSTNGEYLERNRTQFRLSDKKLIMDEVVRFDTSVLEKTVRRIKVSNNGQYEISLREREFTSTGWVSLWLTDKTTGKQRPFITKEDGEIEDAVLTSDNRSLLVLRRYLLGVQNNIVDERSAAWQYVIHVYDVATGRRTRTIRINAERIALSPDQKLLACSFRNRVRLVNFETLETVTTLGNTADRVAALSVLPGKTGFLHAAGLAYWSVELANRHIAYTHLTPQNLRQPLYPTETPDKVAMSSLQIRDGNRFAENGGQITELSNDGKAYIAEILTLSEKRVGVNLYKYLGLAKIQGETKTGNRSSTISHAIRVPQVGKTVLKNPTCTIGNNSIIADQQITRIERNGSEVARFVGLDSGEWILITPEGYYTASKGAAKAVAFQLDEQTYPFDQFDLKLNRPDIVLERLGYTDLKTVAAYRKLYEKRLKQAGITEKQFAPDFHTPLIKIDQKALLTSTQVSTATINVRVLDDRQNLASIEAMVNGVPAKGIDLKNKQRSEWAGAVSVELSPGRNRIQIWAVNDQQAESRKQTFEIFFDDKAFRPDLYVLTIGVGQYADSSIPTLLYAKKDATDIGAAFSAEKTRWRSVKTLNLLDIKASRESIRKAMTEFLASSRIGDTVIVYFAGHGTVTDDYYFVCYDTTKAKLEESGLAFGEIDKLLAQIPARRRLLFLDTCQSGEPDKEALGEGITTKPVVVASNSHLKSRALDPIIADPNSTLGFSRSLEWMRELFANLDRGSGATVIGASGWQELAYEDASKGYKNGLFAYALLSGIRNSPLDKKAPADRNKDGSVSVSELREWIEGVVLKESGGSQRPTVRQENLEDDFVIQ